jgi:HEAT repeat protein
VRRSAIQALARMKHGGLAVHPLIALLNTDTDENRVAAIHTLAAVADKNTEEIIAVAIARQRYHKAEKVRRAVEKALNKLENKRNP